MADPAVCGFLTGLLCAQGGRLELRELLGLIELSEEQLLEVLSEAGPERFVLLDRGPDAGPTVLATTPARVCRRVTCGGACEALHLCKLNLLDRCRRESNYCKYSHDIHSEKNIKILKKHDISVLSKNELAVLLLQSDPFFLPDICKYYKGENRKDSCTNSECMKLHICEHFIEGKCGYVHCNRSHDLMDTKVLEFLKEGLTIPVIRNIQDICNQKHIRSKKCISRRRDKSGQRNVRYRSQSRNRYFLGTQELPTSPSASVGPAHVPKPDKTGPAPLPSSEGKVNERRAPENNSSLRQDDVQSVSASTKTVGIQQTNQLGTNLSRREDQYGTQGSTQHAASTSAPAPAASAPPAPAGDSHLFRRVKVLFGNDDDSCCGPAPQTTSKSESPTSSNYTNAANDCKGQKTYPSSAPSKTVDMWDMRSSAVVFSKYKPAANVKKQEFPSKSQDNQSTLVNAQMDKTATLKEQKIPAANNLVTSNYHDTRSEMLREKMQHWESSMHKVDTMTLDLERIHRNDREETLCVPQKSQASHRDKAAVAHVRPKTLSARDVPQRGIQKDSLAQSSLPTAPDLKTAAATLRKQVIDMQVTIGSPTVSVSASPSQTLATLSINKSRALSPSKSTNAEDFRARILNTTLSGMENNDSDMICLDYLNGDHKLQECCKDVHFHLPYRWQMCISNVWEDLKDMEEIEKAYCDPNISRSHGIDFQEMLLGFYPVRRLSTPSTVQNSSRALTTKWHWYWKNELGQWIEYGKEEGSEFTSEDLELFFLLCPETFSSGHSKFKLNFNEMTQTNIASGITREVRRRPQFVSSVTVYWNQKRTNQSQEQNTIKSFNFPSSWNQMALSERKYEIPSSSAACERNCSLVENIHMKSRSTQACGKIKELISMWEILQFTQVHKEENHKISEAETTDNNSSENEMDLK